MKKSKTLNKKDLLKKNPEAAKILARYQAKLRGQPRRGQKEYGLGLPYARPAAVASAEDDDRTELYA